MSKRRKYNPHKQNEALVNSLAQISARNREMNQDYISKRDTSLILSSTAIALYRLLDSTHDDKIEQIMTILGEIQTIWNMYIEDGVDVCELCEKETGLNLKVEYEVYE